MAISKGMENLNDTGGKGAGIVGHDGIHREGGLAHVGQSEDEALGNTFGQLCEADRKHYGVKDDEWVYGARLPERWQSIEGKNRVQELARQHGCARVLKDKDGMNPLHGSDNIMVALPLAPEMERQRRMKEELRRQQADLEETQIGDFKYLEEHSSNAANDPDLVVPFTLGMKDMLRKIALQNRRNNHSTSLMGPGSPTSGRMSLSRAESMYTPEQIEAEERRHAGTTTQTPMSVERWTKMRADMDPTAKNQREKMFGFSDSGFVNPNSALAQARRNTASKR